jgi:hypothetical protein
MVESREEAVRTDDPCDQPACRVTDHGEPLEVFVQSRVPSLLHLCLSAAATNLAARAKAVADPTLSTNRPLGTHTHITHGLEQPDWTDTEH